MPVTSRRAGPGRPGPGRGRLGGGLAWYPAGDCSSRSTRAGPLKAGSGPLQAELEKRAASALPVCACTRSASAHCPPKRRQRLVGSLVRCPLSFALPGRPYYSGRVGSEPPAHRRVAGFNFRRYCPCAVAPRCPERAPTCCARRAHRVTLQLLLASGRSCSSRSCLRRGRAGA